MPVIECDPSEARDRLEAAGIEIDQGNTEHERWRATHEGATAVAYDDKVVVQGERPQGLVGRLSDDHDGQAYVYFDGASRGNPGPAAIGWVIVTSDGIVDEGGERIGKATNNEAEYHALIRGVTAAQDYGFDSVIVQGDSELIVKQIRGEYDVNAPGLKDLRVTALERLTTFDTWELNHVPRSVNERADSLAADALDD